MTSLIAKHVKVELLALFSSGRNLCHQLLSGFIGLRKDRWKQRKPSKQAYQGISAF